MRLTPFPFSLLPSPPPPPPPVFPQRELGSHQKSINAANTTGEHHTSEILDDPSVTEQDLQEMNKMWDTICQKSTEKQERLDAAYKVLSLAISHCALYLCMSAKNILLCSVNSVLCIYYHSEQCTLHILSQ